MSEFFLNTTKIPAQEKDWGSLKSLFDGEAIDAAGRFNLGYIVYNKPHYSGVHDDHEVIYIIEGRGSALIGNQEVEFGDNFLLVIPAGTEHSIARITAGPVKAILAHFT
jgi:mannose-6-phosphate isomerase-like protein (cupin superfamily)